MKIICLVKFVPDAEKFEYDEINDRINRETSCLVLNPDDKNALAWALQAKKTDKNVNVEVVSMGPKKIEKELKDFVRLGANKATLICDKAYAGSDSLATSRVLAKYLSEQNYDLLLTGTHTLDGGTGHIGPQVAELLAIDQFSNVKKIDCFDGYTIVEALQDNQILQLKIPFPCLISIISQINVRLGFVRYENIDKNVDEQFSLVTNETLVLDEHLIGRKGSPTKVRKNIFIKPEKKDHQTMQVDDEGIETVVAFLQEKGYL
ncbi:electron transfer flavoprotein subunit beta/FixA family protein [Enterococcus alishanensis]|uniref:Electron transfer flavoprotein small subunit n=1 Tax=Enterococcus alishanensis TaxID=1303817 RepID=A0ABS6TEE3_9ENTE|nr:electron transfer flavoprotein subunit beta/FixA family protein [Enterococcus alishanensis]MBV7391285.1 electron transfer flavoprotein subunit beta/FixA family protein [Enterococcus alishanensis]